jgi:prephenate dehydrogenase
VSGERALTIEVVPERWTRVSIVGLGVIGGSMARALRQRLSQLELVGIDRAEVVRGAPRSLVDECIIEMDLEAVQRAFATSDLVFLAAPIHAIRRWLTPALAHAALVTDCGSTKRELARAAQALPSGARFVPGHPMAGIGAGAARGAVTADLFEGWPWLLCPEGVDPRALEAVERLVALVGARPVHLAAAQHDWAVALTSHAPRLIASVLTALVEREGAFIAAGPAFERLMRGAGGGPEMWRDVLQTNADQVARALRVVLAELGACADELERAQVDGSLRALAAAEHARETLEEQHTPRR